jgi:hypothetical protein
LFLEIVGVFGCSVFFLFFPSGAALRGEMVKWLVVTLIAAMVVASPPSIESDGQHVVVTADGLKACMHTL